MALYKEKQTEYGVNAGYWKIGMISIDKTNKEGSYSLFLYISKEATKPIESIGVSLLSMEDKTRYYECFEPEDKDIYKACYEDAKKYEEYFKDATNI